jgi:hypothetical protein
MPSRTRLFCALALCVALFCPGLATAALTAPDGSVVEQAQPSPQQALEAVKNLADQQKQAEQAVATALSKAGSQQTPAQPGSNPPAPKPKPGGGKVIYGDIIIHK